MARRGLPGGPFLFRVLYYENGVRRKIGPADDFDIRSPGVIAIDPHGAKGIVRPIPLHDDNLRACSFAREREDRPVFWGLAIVPSRGHGGPFG
jgi:hypothetical protein